jgi:hypothetical protein
VLLVDGLELDERIEDVALPLLGYTSPRIGDAHVLPALRSRVAARLIRVTLARCEGDSSLAARSSASRLKRSVWSGVVTSWLMRRSIVDFAALRRQHEDGRALERFNSATRPVMRQCARAFAR